MLRQATVMPARHQTKSTGRVEWLILLATVALSVLFSLGFRGTPPFHPGVVRSVTISVVPEDAQRHRCLEKQKTQGFSCEDRSVARLAPFVTTARELILLPGVFSYPKVQAETRLRQRKRGSERRFRISCTVELLQYTRSHQVKFGPRAPVEPAAAWIAKTLDCAPSQ